MDKPTVFISYRHCERDQQILARLQDVVLKPLERDGLIAVWTDRGIEPGERWRAEIDQALACADIGVLLLSQDFLASDFVWNTELPLLFRREAAEEVTLIPVYVSPFDDAVAVRFEDASGRPQAVRPSERQGIASPTQTLSHLDDTAREEAFQQLIKRIRTLADELRAGSRQRNGAAPATAPAPAAPAPAPAGEAIPAGMLVVEPIPTPDGIAIHYRLAGPAPAPLTWPRSEVEAMAATARSDPTASGTTLFRLLFGDRPTSQGLFRTLFGRPDDQPPPSPIAAPVRLRIITADPDLLLLPWARLAREGLRLIDYHWEIVTGAEPVPRRRCRTIPGAELLVVTDPSPPPDADRSAVPRRRHSPVTALLDGLCPTPAGRVREVTDSAALRNALDGMRPHLAYIDCACAKRDGQPILLLGDGGRQAFPLAALEQELLPPAGGPCLVILALRGEAAPRLMAGLAQRLGTRVALVLCLAPSPAGPGAIDPGRQALLAMLQAWLGDGEDPVQALHRLLRAAPGLGPAEALPSAVRAPLDPALIAIHANYRDWQTTPLGRSRRDPRPHLALDRDRQKAIVTEHVRKLARRPHDRVLLIVAYGSPENLVAELSRQLQWHLELPLAGQAALAAQTIGLPEVQLPAGDDALDAAIEQLHAACEPHLRETLRADPDETATMLLRRHAPRGLRPGERGLLWLDWGHVDRAEPGADRLAEAALSALPRFCAETLTAACPDGLRLVGILTVELPEDKYPGIAALFETLQDEPWYDRDGFRFLPLDPLGQVDRDHLRDYLTDIETGLDARSRRDLVRLILAETGGDFDTTVALLDEGRHTSWLALLQRLEARQARAKRPKRKGFLS